MRITSCLLSPSGGIKARRSSESLQSKLLQLQSRLNADVAGSPALLLYGLGVCNCSRWYASESISKNIL